MEGKVDRKTQTSDDTDAYDLIMRDKERLLSLDEPVRFIFSHSALREGWDNPNAFQICTLKTQGESRSLFFDRITAVYKAIAPEKCLFFFSIVL